VATPAITILLPAFDAAATVDATLKSVQRQTETDWECLVIDDGSSDHTATVVSERARADRRIRLLSRPHEGIVRALNAGLEQARGALLARVDADDLMHRERLSLQRAALEADGSLCGVGAHVRLFPRRAMSQGLLAYERWLGSVKSAQDVRREAFVECPLAHPTLMLRREALTGVVYRDCAWPEDYDLLLRLLAEGRRLGVVPRRLLHWRDGPTRLSRSSPRYGQPAFVECKAEYLASTFLSAAERYVLWGFGDTGKALSRALARRGKHLAAIVELHPGRLGQRIGDAPVVAPEALRTLPRRPLVVSVAGLTPRTQIRAALGELGYRELDDFVVAA
jgi:glycosyltransferase involved in cell wall biosynthesis